MVEAVQVWSVPAYRQMVYGYVPWYQEGWEGVVVVGDLTLMGDERMGLQCGWVMKRVASVHIMLKS